MPVFSLWKAKGTKEKPIKAAISRENKQIDYPTLSVIQTQENVCKREIETYSATDMNKATTPETQRRDFYSAEDRAAYNKLYKEQNKERLAEKAKARYYANIEYFRRRNRLHNQRYRRRQAELRREEARLAKRKRK